jgi:hypothetical protein
MQAVRSSETSINFHQTTRCDIPHLQSYRRDNLKSSELISTSCDRRFYAKESVEKPEYHNQAANHDVFAEAINSAL